MKTIAGFAKQLKEELLEVVNHTHTVKRDKESVFYRRTSLKPVQRKAVAGFACTTLPQEGIAQETSESTQPGPKAHLQPDSEDEDSST